MRFSRHATLPLAAGLVIGTGAQARTADLGPLVSAGELQTALGEVEVLDIREEGYEAGHVEGAVNAPYGLFRGPEENPGQVPSDAALGETLGELGLEPSDRIVIAY